MMKLCTKEKPFAFHKAVVERKKDAMLKARVEAIENGIQNAFDLYDYSLNNNSLDRMNPMVLNHSQIKDLNSLYSFEAKKFKELWIDLTTDERGRKITTCPNCGLDRSNTFDHYAPQSKFPEFSDNPHNLIPCCGICNGHKSKKWLDENGCREIINQYTDIPLETQCLFVVFSFTGDSLNVKFEVRNDNNVEKDRFSLFSNHYKNLHLCERYSSASSETIEVLANDIQSRSECGMDDDKIKETMSTFQEKERRLHGQNYWKAILITECVNNDEVFQYLKNYAC